DPARRAEDVAPIARPERRWPRQLASAPASIDTVAAFRPWRGFRPSVARGRRGHHRTGPRNARPLMLELAERGGFEPPKRGLGAYTLSRRAPSTTRTPLREVPGRRRPAARRGRNSSGRQALPQPNAG